MKKILLILVFIPLYSMDHKADLKVRVEEPIATTSYQEEPLSARESPNSLSPTSISNLRESPPTPYPRPSSKHPFLDTMLSKHRRIVETLDSLGKESETNRRRAEKHKKIARISKREARDADKLNKRNKLIGAVSTLICSLLTYLVTQYNGKC